MTVLGNRGLSLSKLIITQLLSICRLVTSSFKRQKQTLLILLTGCNFRVWSTILKQVKNPQSPCRSEIKIEPRARRPKCAIFPLFIYLFIIIIIQLFFLGGSKLSIMIATLKKNRTKQPPTHPPESKDELRKSHNLPFIWGRWGELMKSFCLFCQKTALHNLKTGKDVLVGSPYQTSMALGYFLVGKQCKQTVDCKTVSFFPIEIGFLRCLRKIFP